MIIKDSEAVARLNSPLNLINRLRSGNGNGNKKNSAMSLFGIGRKKEEDKEIKEISFNPFQTKEQLSSSVPAAKEIPQQASSETNLDNILENHESQIKLGLAHDKSLELLTRSVDILSAKLDDVKADKLPAVVTAASKVVESIRRERNEASKNSKDREVHYHFYTPEQRKITDYEIIDVNPA